MGWRSVVFNDESRFCLYASDWRTRVRRRPCERHLPDCICPRHTGPISGFLVWGPLVTTRDYILCFCRVKWTVPATLHKLLTPCYTMCSTWKWCAFQWDNARPLKAAATQRALRGVQKLPWPARTPDLSPIEHVWDTRSGNLLFLQNLPQPLPDRYNVWKMLGKIYRRMTFGIFMTVCIWEYTTACCQGVHFVLMWLLGHHVLWHVCFI